MRTGIVKWFSPQKKFGFIVPDNTGPDVFVHISALEDAGLDSLNEGQKIQFDLAAGKNGKESAVNLKLL